MSCNTITVLVQMYQRDGTGDDMKPIDLRLSFLKPQGFKWLADDIEKMNGLQK